MQSIRNPVRGKRQGPVILLRPDHLANTKEVSIVAENDLEEAIAISYLRELGISYPQTPLRVIEGARGEK